MGVTQSSDGGVVTVVSPGDDGADALQERSKELEDELERLGAQLGQLRIIAAAAPAGGDIVGAGTPSHAGRPHSPSSAATYALGADPTSPMGVSNGASSSVMALGGTDLLGVGPFLAVAAAATAAAAGAGAAAVGAGAAAVRSVSPPLSFSSTTGTPGLAPSALTPAAAPAGAAALAAEVRGALGRYGTWLQRREAEAAREQQRLHGHVLRADAAVKAAAAQLEKRAADRGRSSAAVLLQQQLAALAADVDRLVGRVEAAAGGVRRCRQALERDGGGAGGGPGATGGQGGAAGEGR